MNASDPWNPICRSCRPGSKLHRYESPDSNCSCLPGYHERNHVSGYCCPDECEDCDERGRCLNCSRFTYRELRNGSCQCKQGFVQNATEPQCVCATGSTIFQGECVKCPLNCEECTYLPIYDYFLCTECPHDETRE